MRILFVSRDFPPAIGGVSQMAHGLVEACSELGHDVTVLAPGANDGPAAPELYKIIRDRRLPPAADQRSRRLPYAHGTNREILRLVQSVRPDAILVGVYRTYGAACVKAGARCGIPVGGLVHGLDVLRALRQSRSRVPRLRGALGFPTDRQHMLTYLRGAQKIFANSSATSGYVEQCSGRGAIIVGCGVRNSVALAATGLERSRSERSATRARLGLPDAPTIGFLGRLVARKNAEAVINSLKELPECTALIIGDGPRRGSLEVLARQLGVSKRVTFAGQVEEGAKQEYLRAMDVFCMPSRAIDGYNVEGFGIVFLEATAAGVPVVGGRSGGIPDVVQHERTGLLADPNDWRDVARCLRRMLADRQLAASCVAAAQARLRDDFNWASIARRVVSELAV